MSTSSFYNAHRTSYDTKLPAYGLKSNGDFLSGNGTPGTHFNIDASSAGHNEVASGNAVALQVIHRQGPAYSAASVDKDGTIHFNVEDGSQIGNPARAEWSINYAFLHDPKVKGDLGQSELHLMIDVDPSNKVKYLDLVQDHGVWKAADSAVVAKGTAVISDDAQAFNSKHGLIASENSENIVFFNPGYGAGGYQAGAEFDFQFVVVADRKPFDFGPSALKYNTDSGELVPMLGVHIDSHLHAQVDVV